MYRAFSCARTMTSAMVREGCPSVVCPSPLRAAGPADLRISPTYFQVARACRVTFITPARPLLESAFRRTTSCRIAVVVQTCSSTRSCTICGHTTSGATHSTAHDPYLLRFLEVPLPREGSCCHHCQASMFQTKKGNVCFRSLCAWLCLAFLWQH